MEGQWVNKRTPSSSFCVPLFLSLSLSLSLSPPQSIKGREGKESKSKKERKEIGSEVATFSTIGNMHEEGGKKYPAFSIYEKNELMRKFNCLKLLAGGSVKEHISVMKRLLNDISLAGHDFKEDLKIHVILYSLPDSWDDFVGTLFAIKNTVGLTFDSVCQALEYEEDRRFTRRKEAEITSCPPR